MERKSLLLLVIAFALFIAVPFGLSAVSTTWIVVVGTCLSGFVIGELLAWSVSGQWDWWKS